MFNYLFKFLLRKGVSYSVALVIPGLVWAAFGAILGGAIILNKACFPNNDAKNTFLLAYSVCVIIAIFFTLAEFGFPSFFKKITNKDARIVNKNIAKGEIETDISNQDLVKVYSSLDKIYVLLYNRNWQLTLAVAITMVVVDYLISHQLNNSLIILLTGLIVALTTSIYNVTVAEGELMFSLRKNCRDMLCERSISYKDHLITSLKGKFRIFTLLIVLMLAVIFFLIYPLTFNLIIISLIGFGMIIMIIQTIFFSFYRAFEDVQVLAKKMGIGEEVVFHSGSTDSEIITLSKSLNQTVENIKKYQDRLKEAKSILEIKVAARTKELGELAQNLEGKVRERTEELQKKTEQLQVEEMQLQERIDELEEFHRLTVGREIKMIELKNKIKELEEKMNLSKA